MSRLREAATAFARIDRHPVLPTERLFATERVAAGLEARRLNDAEPWADLVERAREPGGLSAAELVRLLRGLWRDRAASGRAASVIGQAVALGRRSTNRALIEAYLGAYPRGHAAFDTLRDAAALAAGRHDWRWREAGEQWRLWEGPEGLGAALRAAPDPEALLREAGFAGRLADGGFVSAARAGAARSAR